LLAAAVVAVIVTIATGSAQAFSHYGLGLLTSGTWSPDSGQFAPGVLVVDTLVVSGVAMVLAVPVGLGTAIALAEVLPSRVAGFIASVIDLLAGVPSIVIGLWALVVLLPVFERDVEPHLQRLPLLGRSLFGGFAYGTGILLCATVLAVLALPTIISLARSALLGVPQADREAARALGATKWQAVRRVLLPTARSGIGAAITLATARVLAESIAVALVIGSTPSLPRSLLSQGVTLGSGIVNNFGEAEPGLQRSAVIALGAVLFVLTLLVNLAGRALWGRARKPGRMEAARVPTLASVGPPGGLASMAGPGPAPYYPPATSPGPLDPAEISRRSLPRRLWAARAGQGLCSVLVVVALAPLAALLGYTAVKGVGAISWGFFFTPANPLVPSGGGISTAIAGTLKVVGLALALAVPTSLLGALFLYERSGRVANVLRAGVEVLAGVPTIVIGIFAYTVIVVPLHHPTLWAGSVAVAVVMLPVMTRANEEAVRAVPQDLHEAGAALGARRGRVMRSVVLRTSLPGLVAGNLLAVARATGETAPLLFTLAAPTMAMTLTIYNDATQDSGSLPTTAWGTALVLLAGILLLSLSARAVAAHLTRKAR
jgi:phosphate ABC transporter permease protein PstC/phosphate ABC transporter permease subunit PstA